jgi:dienelactone hydrolase
VPYQPAIPSLSRDLTAGKSELWYPNERQGHMCHPDVPANWETIQTDGSEVMLSLPSGEEMPALLVGPSGAPGVLLIGDVYGRSAFYEQLASRIAAHGFQVVLPDYFFRQGPVIGDGQAAAFARRAQLDEIQSVADMRAAVDWMREQSSHPAVGVIGFCMGGTFALDLASTEDDLVSVSYYGFPVPQASIVHPPTPPMDLVAELRGPVLAFWGDADEIVGVEHIRRYIERATLSNSRFRSEVLPGLGHAFLAAADLADPDDPATGTWNRTLAHLRSYLLEEARP